MVCNFSNVAFTVFELPIHWYSLAYIFGILIALKLTKVFANLSGSLISGRQLEDFLSYAVMGIIVGGRLGYVLFYDFEYYSYNAIEILKVWKGGMSFYGGFIGVISATYLFCEKYKIDFWNFIDLWSISVPIGLFFGRIANFVNGELLGKESYVAWNVVFKDGIHRHPSQIYEAILEGVFLFIVMFIAFRKKCYKYYGRLSSIFCMGYGISRFFAECFREPDSSFSYRLFYSSGLNLNQYISIMMIILGVILIKKSCRRT